ncbi:MAG: uridine diphosphate-N-acetylglucosamine-binding protein YvcK [Peptoniphilaceae bacterium]|nr:uridine diphosphate-N-acetylglucosamine-binding protein YvcK [Peptoniphilaceae bacterium]MDD7382873.1 uridine diphosphate-N-acetylglucosamine-binding protein YvcK [Peptoniphilaceae bacterium]MDY3738168.1 uridine diphosphate-N-acetylglucosamine-binding protein YvcK [Peptoniphilaceae bacterium]
MKLTTIGGGTGSSSILKGLKNYIDDISAVVTVADDGGSSGRLRKEYGILPPGDIRSCIQALADSEDSMTKVLNYRFKTGDLEGHSLGNLLILALSDIFNGFNNGIEEVSNILNIKGKIFPMTLDNVILYAKLDDGRIIEGESNITFLARKSRSKIVEVFLKPFNVNASEGISEKIFESDYIILGPGSLFTSIMPNLLVKEIREALINTRAKIIYIANIMEQNGETNGFSISDHVSAINHHIGENIIDYIFVNNKKISTKLLYKYFYEQNSCQIFLTKEDIKYLNSLNINIIEEDFLDTKSNFIRHDGEKIAKIIMEKL